jgi:hypothetical protein
MFDGGVCSLGPKKAILRVLFPIPAIGLAELGRAGTRAPFTHASGLPFPVPGGSGTMGAGRRRAFG